MNLRLKALGFVIFFLAPFHHSPFNGHVEVASAASEGPDSTIGNRFLDKAKEGKRGRMGGLGTGVEVFLCRLKR